MITLLIVLGSILAYFGIGFALAIRALPYAWQHAKLIYPEEGRDVRRRDNVALWCVFRVLLWPFLTPALLMAYAMDRTDPVRRAAIDREQKARIADLERELGIR